MGFFGRNEFMMRKLHSLFGVIPVGGFLMMHLFANATSLKGAQAFNDTVAFYRELPALVVLELVGIFIPMYFHAIYGIYIAFEARHNVRDYSYGRNWAFFWQRVTGLITLVFVTWHVWQFRLANAFGLLLEVDHQSVAAVLANPVWFAIYVVGVVAAVYHFANGLWGFLIHWGITTGPRAQRIANVVTTGLFVVVSAVGVGALVGFLK